MNDISKRIGQRIRELRKQAGLTQEDLAERAGMDFTSIGAAERGNRNLSLKSLARVAEALGVSLEEIFRGLGTVQRSPQHQSSFDALLAEVSNLSPAEIRFLTDVAKALRSLRR